MPSVTEETLKKMRGSPASYDSQGLQAPMLDPIMLIASLLGPMGLSALRSTPQMASEAAPEAMSQADSLLARLRANQPQIQQGMDQQAARKTLPNFAKTIDRSAVPMRPDMPMDVRPPMNVQPYVNDSTLWDYMRPTAGSNVERPMTGDFFEKYGHGLDTQGHEAWIGPHERWAQNSFNMMSQTSPQAAFSSYYRSGGDPRDLANIAARLKLFLQEQGSGMDAVATLKRMRAAARN